MRLNTNHRFIQSKTQREAMIEFKRASDPIAAFLTEECEFDPEYYVQGGQNIRFLQGLREEPQRHPRGKSRILRENTRHTLHQP